MTAALWQRYQEWLYYDDRLGLYLDISRMRFDEQVIEQLKPQFQRAFKAMAALEAGAIANPDEQRMVGHYWLRTPELAPTAAIQAEIEQTLTQVTTFAQQVHTGQVRSPHGQPFTDLVVIGIGGSALGSQFVTAALAPVAAPLEIHFIDNTDPAGIDRLLARLGDRLATTLVITISKSGRTPETHNGMLEVQRAYADRRLSLARAAVAITGADSQLARWAKAAGWLTTFALPDWVGGRTSVFSAVGLLPAALQGIDITALLAGARHMDRLTRVSDIRTNPAALLALAWYVAGQGHGEKAMVVLPYKDSLLLFSRYLQQLVMESLGKERDLEGAIVQQGLTVYGNKGSTDQHAYVQQLREGLPNFFLTLIEVLRDRAGTDLEVEPGITTGDYLSGLLQGTRRAIFDNHRDVLTITIPTVDAERVGAMIALYERAVGLYGSLINVNAYHQPGVEAGKQAAMAVLELQHRIIQVMQATEVPLSLSALADQVHSAHDIEAVYLIVRHLHANQRVLSLQGDFSQPASLTVSGR